MHLNHPQTLPTTPFVEKLSSVKPVPGAEKVGGLWASALVHLSKARYHLSALTPIGTPSELRNRRGRYGSSEEKISHIYFYITKGFPGGSSGEESSCQCRRGKGCRFDPWVGKISWKWQPIPVFLPRKFNGQRSLVGYSPEAHKELTWLKQLSTHMYQKRDSCDDDHDEDLVSSYIVLCLSADFVQKYE